MLKRLLIVAAAVGAFGFAGCSSGSCSKGGCKGPVCLHPCECPCYSKNYCRKSRQMMDFIDVYFLNYDRHDPYRCDPCLGD
jgi:hypothetical protein